MNRATLPERTVRAVQPGSADFGRGAFAAVCRCAFRTGISIEEPRNGIEVGQVSNNTDSRRVRTPAERPLTKSCIVEPSANGPDVTFQTVSETSPHSIPSGERSSAASILAWRSREMFRELRRIQKIIQVSTATARNAMVPSIACSERPSRSPMRASNTNPLPMLAMAAAPTPIHIARRCRRLSVLTR